MDANGLALLHSMNEQYHRPKDGVSKDTFYLALLTRDHVKGWDPKSDVDQKFVLVQHNMVPLSLLRKTLHRCSQPREDERLQAQAPDGTASGGFTASGK